MLTCHLVDEGPNRLINEVAFEFIPTCHQAAGAPLFQLEEGSQGAEDVIANGPLPAHEELLGMADLLKSPMVAFNGPVLLVDVHEMTIGDFHALFFFAGRIGCSVSARRFYRAFETPSQSQTCAGAPPCHIRATPGFPRAGTPARVH